MTWWLGELLAFDTETTGVDVESDRIVTVTLAHIRPNAEPEVLSYLIAVDVDIPQAATDVHGVTTDRARAEGAPTADVLDRVAAHLAEAQANGTPIVGMNVAFDLTVLDRELRRNGLPTVEDRLHRPVGPCVDIRVIDKEVDRYRKGGRTLTDLCAAYGVRHGGAHDATEDALAAARVAYRIGQRSTFDLMALRTMYADRPRQAPHIAAAFVMVGRMTLADLHQAQVRWYADQAASLAQHWYRQANELEHRAGLAADDADRATASADARELRTRADGVDTAWPMRPLATDDMALLEVAA